MTGSGMRCHSLRDGRRDLASIFLVGFLALQSRFNQLENLPPRLRIFDPGECPKQFQRFFIYCHTLPQSPPTLLNWFPRVAKGSTRPLRSSPGLVAAKWHLHVAGRTYEACTTLGDRCRLRLLKPAIATWISSRRRSSRPGSLKAIRKHARTCCRPARTALP